MKRILLADDEQASSDIIQYFIRKYELPLDVVGITTRGDETVEAVKRLCPDIVFLDIEMPGMNGLQTLEVLEREYKRDISYVIITANATVEYLQRALRLKVKDFLMKPILYEQFCEMMERVLAYRYSDNPLFNQLMEFMNQHYMDDLRLADCAAALATSESNVVRLFKQYLNTSFTAYNNEIRIRKAKELLAGGCSIKETTWRVGYNNMNYFYRLFKRQTGVTPKEYLDSSKTNVTK